MTFDGRVEAVINVPAGVVATVTNNGGGPTSVPITAGSYYISTLMTQLAADFTAGRAPSLGAWSFALSTGPSGTGQVTIAMSSGNFAITWTNTLLRDLLGFAGDIASTASSTGTAQARGLWIPDCPLTATGDPKRAPMASDMRSVVSPKGDVYTLVGNTYLQHTQLTWSMVAINRVWAAEASLANAAYETFFKDALLGVGVGAGAWFTPGSGLKIYDQRGLAVGADANVSAWQAVTPPGLDTLTMSQQQFTGFWKITWPTLTSSG